LKFDILGFFENRNDSNFKRKETENPSKFKDLEIEVSRMWRLGTKI